jgi:hypothetical protein
VIASVVTYYPRENFKRDFLDLNEPYPLIGHYLGELEAYRATYHNSDIEPIKAEVKKANTAKSACDKEAFDHLDLLFEFLKTSHYMTHITEEQEGHTRNLCTFRMLWLLFKPGKTVYMESGGQLYAYVISSMGVDKRILSTTSRWLTRPYVVELWGKSITRPGISPLIRQYSMKAEEETPNSTLVQALSSTIRNQDEDERQAKNRAYEWRTWLRFGQSTE